MSVHSIFLSYSGLNSGPHAWYAVALQHELSVSPVFMLGIFEKICQDVFAWD
jgi:hypothetical protein